VPAPPGGDPEPDPETGAGLLERERELAALDAVLAEARRERGRLVAIEAPAGLGKTRLLHAARRRAADAGMAVCSARATELERDFPYALVRQLLAARLLALADAEGERLFDGAVAAARDALGLGRPEATARAHYDAFAVLHGLYWLTAALAERGPLLLAADDLQWADPASLDFLAFLLPRLEELPVALVVAGRPGEGDAERLARLATDDAAVRLTPAALGDGAVTTLLAALLGCTPEPAFAAACRRAAGGNPFLLGELARTVVAERIAPTDAEAERVAGLAPDRVAQVVRLRLAGLPPETAAVARSLAVLGDDAEPRLVADHAGLPPETVATAADQLREVGLATPGRQLRFTHPLLRTALDAELQRGERAEAHARAADLVRADGGSPERIAAHLLESDGRGDREAVTTLLAAAERAMATGAPRAALAYLGRALREPPPAGMRTDVLGALTTASIRASDHAAWSAIEAEVLAELDRSPALRVRWAARVASWLTLSGRAEQAIELLASAIEVADAEADVDRAFRLEGQLATVAQLSPTPVHRPLQRYEGRITPGSSAERFHAASNARRALAEGSAEEATAHARAALADDGRIFSEQGDLLAAAEVVMVLVFAERLDEARQAVAQAWRHARARNAVPELVGAALVSSGVSCFSGNLADSEADVRQALALATDGGLLAAQPALTMLLALTATLRGDGESAERQLAAAGMTGPVPDLPMFNSVLLVRGMLRLDQGRAREAADDVLELTRRKHRWLTGSMAMVPVGAVGVRALVAVGERERALELAAAELEAGRRWGTPGSVATGLSALGFATGGAEGLALMEEAAALVEQSTMTRQRALVPLTLGTALRRAGRRADAREPLRRALEVARRHGAAGIARAARDELLACGEKVRRHAPLGVESLTPSERRIAELAADGLTNRQIAQTLYLTVKTIESHLGAAFDKLGIRSRRQLGEALARE
jgi:DNA-binding CsgD family transcriptional regulator